MSLDKVSNQSLNALFSFFNYLDSLVFWISSPDFKRQLYVSNGFKSIWGHNGEALQAHPELWLETLLQEDLINCENELNSRTQHGGISTIAFRIVRPDGTTRWLKDISYTLVNSDGNPVAIVGIGESLLPEQWHTIVANIQSETYKPKTMPYLQDFLGIINKEYKLITAQEIKNNSRTHAANNKQLVSINGQVTSVSRRQAECLQYLKQGMSAKQTAKVLKLSPRTIEYYLENLRRKFDCPNKLILVNKLQLIDDLVI